MAISVSWAATATLTTAPTCFYTVPSASTVPYGAYARDMVITNSGSGTIFVAVGGTTAATSVSGFQLPAGGSVILTQCQVPQGLFVSGAAASTATTSTYLVSLGFGTNVAYI